MATTARTRRPAKRRAWTVSVNGQLVNETGFQFASSTVAWLTLHPVQPDDLIVIRHRNRVIVRGVINEILASPPTL